MTSDAWSNYSALIFNILERWEPLITQPGRENAALNKVFLIIVSRVWEQLQMKQLEHMVGARSWEHLFPSC